MNKIDITMSAIAKIIRDSIAKQGIKVIPYIQSNMIYFKRSTPDTTLLVKVKVFDLEESQKNPNIMFYSNDVSQPVTLKVLHDLYGDYNHQMLKEQVDNFKLFTKEVGFNIIKDIRLFKSPAISLHDRQKLTVLGNIKLGFKTLPISDISSFYYVGGNIVKQPCIQIPDLDYTSSILTPNNMNSNSNSFTQSLELYIRKIYFFYNELDIDSNIVVSKKELKDFTKVIEMLEY